MGFISWHVRLGVACGLLALAGCGGKDANPVGAGLVNRKDLGRVVRLSPIPAVQQFTTFRGLQPIRNGFEPSTRAGSLNGIGVTALWRFALPTDTLLAASGGADVSLVSVRIVLRRRASESTGTPRYVVGEPASPWSEMSIFADTTRWVETPLTVNPISSASVEEEADTTRISLSPSYVRSRLRLTGRAAGEADTLEVSLQAAAGARFLTSWVALDAPPTEAAGRPWVEVKVRGAGDSIRTFALFGSGDTFYAAREAGTPDPTVLTVGTVFRYWSYLKFAMPDSIPKRATINSARLEADIVQPGVFPTSSLILINRLLIDSATRDTASAPGITTEYVAGSSLLSTEIGPFIVASWTTGQAPNDGIVLHPLLESDPLWWVALRNPRLTITYSLPPGTE